MNKIITASTNNNSFELCKNKLETEKYILAYKDSTTSAVESILNMGIAVRDVYNKSKTGELNKHDLEYFCESIGLNQSSSQFRKYKRIGEKADIFKEYMEKMPNSFSVIYEIATLDADTFDRLYVVGTTPPNITLSELKKLAKKTKIVPAGNTISKHNPNFLKKKTLKNYLNEINQFKIYIYSNLTQKQVDEVTGIFMELQQKGFIRFDLPDVIQYTDNFNEKEKLGDLIETDDIL